MELLIEIPSFVEQSEKSKPIQMIEAIHDAINIPYAIHYSLITASICIIRARYAIVNYLARRIGKISGDYL
jgi:hypothetical protein